MFATPMSVLLPLTVILFIVLVMVNVGAPGASLSMLPISLLATNISSFAALLYNLPYTVQFDVTVVVVPVVQLPLPTLYCIAYPLGIVPE